MALIKVLNHAKCDITLAFMHEGRTIVNTIKAGHLDEDHNLVPGFAMVDEEALTKAWKENDIVRGYFENRELEVDAGVITTQVEVDEPKKPEAKPKTLDLSGLNIKGPKPTGL